MCSIGGVSFIAICEFCDYQYEYQFPRQWYVLDERTFIAGMIYQPCLVPTTMDVLPQGSNVM